jgi:hypothetical protein
MPGTLALSDYLENAIINATLRGTTFPAPPASVYIALFTTSPGDAGTGTEVTGGAYARSAVSTTGGWAAPSGGNGSTSNVADIVFTSATADWGTVTHIAIFDALTTGNMLYWGALTTPKVVSNGDLVKFLAGTLVLTLD